MKRNWLYLAIGASVLLLGSCTQDAEMNEALPQNTETTMDAFKPMTFEQTRALVGEVLGSDAAARIEPTSRYVRVFFDSSLQLLEEMAREEITYSDVPAPGFEDAVVAGDDEHPSSVFALLDRDDKLPANVRYDVLAEFFAPSDPQSGLTPDEALTVEAAMNTTTRVATNWKPSGRVEYRDELTGEYYPMEGLRVVIFGYSSSMQMIQETVRTDADGNFTTTTTYAALPGTATIQWKDTRWSILSSRTDIASTGQVIDPNTMPRWNCIISSAQGVNFHYATAYRAAEYMDSHGYAISSQKGSSIVSICCLNESTPIGGGDSYAADGEATNAKVIIYCKDKSPLSIYSAVTCEVGKAVHMIRINADNTKDYSTYSDVITGSWGEYTKYYFTASQYNEMNALDKIFTMQNGVYVPNYTNRQDWYYDTGLAARRQCRTPMFLDIQDDFDQSEWQAHKTDMAKYPTHKYPEDGFRAMTFGDSFSEIADWAYDCKNVEEFEELILGNIGPYKGQQEDAKTLLKIYKDLEAAL